MSSRIDSRPLKVCMLSYRSNPYCGGQGVYVRNLAKAIKDMGHHVDILTGPPRFDFSYKGIKIYKLPSLDLYNPDNLFRLPSLNELMDPVNLFEWLDVSLMGYPEPFIFGLKFKSFLMKYPEKYDVVHDNQSLSYGVLSISKKIPTVATIHHPMTKDRKIAINNARSLLEKIRYLRWYSFIRMQKKVSRSLSKIITVSNQSKYDTSKDFGIPHNRLKVIFNGIDADLFRNLNGIKRKWGRIIVTTSSDSPIKGLRYLLKAIAHLAHIHTVRLVIVGEVVMDGNITKLIAQLGIGNLIKFTGRISDYQLVLQYSKAFVAVVPSLYEGFGFPAGEAMACKVPVIATTGGALPEVVGNAGILVPPKDHLALSAAIMKLLRNPLLAQRFGEKGFLRVREKFNWPTAAKQTVETYKEVMV